MALAEIPIPCRLDPVLWRKALATLKKFVYNIFRLYKEAGFMPNIRSSTDLRNNYNEISTFCHNNREPIFITKNGRGDLAVMSIETYEMLNGKLELYRMLDEGRAAVKEDRKRPLEDVMRDIRQEITDGKI
jgi:PHD/YefM family antitoxin component YafN of YafNO toxin-antitoxin module